MCVCLCLCECFSQLFVMKMSSPSSSSTLLHTTTFYFLQKELERIDDASTEIMMADQGKVLLFMGGAFFETSEEEATTYCEDMVEKYQEKIRVLETEESEILEEQEALKKILYGRFGKSIQLEE